MRAASLGVLVLSCLTLAVGCSLLPESSLTPSTRIAWLDELLAAEDAGDPGNPIFEQALTSPDVEVRRYAYRALGRIGRAESIRPIMTAAGRETDPSLRAEALFALGRTGHSSVVDAAELFILDPNPLARAAAVRALGLAGDERGLITLLDAIRDDAAPVRSAAALGLARMFAAREDPIGNRPVGTFLVIGEQMRRDPDPGVRWAAAYAAGKARREEMRPYLVDALADGDHRVRLFACEGLALLPADPTSRTGLIDALADPEWTVAVEAAKALKNDPAPEVFAALARQIAAPGHPSLHARAAAVEALGACGAQPACPGLLRSALSDPAETVRGVALEALATAGDATEVAALLEDVLATETAAPPTRYLRSRVARAAGLLPDGRGFDLVVRLCEDPEIAVRTTAVATLVRFRERADEITPLLRRTLAEREPALREAAATSAGALELVALLPDLLAAFDDSRGPDFIETRVSLTRAMAKVGRERVAPKLRELLNDEERQVREAARDELARLGGSMPALPRPLPPVRWFTPRAGKDFATGGENPRVKLVTNKGPFVLELLVDFAPHHATAFLTRCRDGFYDGLTFHRLVPGFVVQGLDPRGDGYGTGGAALRNEVNQFRYRRGSVGMPDAGLDTGGCQIFVTFRPQPRLDARYTLFARVVEGMEIVEQLDVGDRVDYVVAPGR